MRLLTWTENWQMARILGFSYSSNAIEGKCSCSQSSVYVHDFSQPHPPSLVVKQNIGGKKRKKIFEKEQYLICKTEIYIYIHIFTCREFIYCSFVNMVLTLSHSIYDTWNCSKTFLNHQGQLYSFGIFPDVCCSPFSCVPSVSAEGALRLWRWNKARSPPVQWVLSFFFTVLPKWWEKIPS